MTSTDQEEKVAHGAPADALAGEAPSLREDRRAAYGALADGPTRRDFLHLMGASAALAGVSACSRAPKETITPYVVQPPEVVPGVAAHYATTVALGGYARGLLVESHEGRPTKIEGNPAHPANLGAASAIEQALVLSLYDPDRARTALEHGVPSTWEAAARFLRGAAARDDGGRGLHLVLEPTTSRLLGDQLARLRARLPEVGIHFRAPLDRNGVWEGARLALGEVRETLTALDRAEVVLALDADFLAEGPMFPAVARAFASRRTLKSSADRPNRLYAVEPVLTVTGAAADHRLPLLASEVLRFAAAVAFEVVQGAAPTAPSQAPFATELARFLHDDGLDEGAESPKERSARAWAGAVARDLLAHRGASLVLVGDQQPAVVHALGHLMNRWLGNVGSTVSYVPSPVVFATAGIDPRAHDRAHDVEGLAGPLERGEVDTLLVLGGNPAYSGFADHALASRFRALANTLYLGPYENETAATCRFVVPQAHPLESWGDACALDGTYSLQQPLIAPLYGGKTVSEVLSVLLGEEASAHDLLSAYWERSAGGSPGSPRASFRAALAAGLVEGSASARDLAESASVAPIAPFAEALAEARAHYTHRASSSASTGLELLVRPDARVGDGTFTNNAWLLELPDPITKLTWENAALLSPATARKHGIADGDLVRLGHRDASLLVPVLVVPGHADDGVALSLGFGRDGGESLARGRGVSAYRLRRSSDPYILKGVALARTERKAELARTQEHGSLEGRDAKILQHLTLAAYRAKAAGPKREEPKLASLYAFPTTAKRQWGMTIDLNACTGCSACVVACQAENNVPVVGKSGVAKHREMHWLRIDRYFVEGPGDDEVDVQMQPMLCQHCEKAPCEYVCPVNATTHSEDGLNQMVYNRCVGTRFCSNNCPYKVRRFNWFDYHQGEGAVVALGRNPDVTVRARGVMEKCSYCVQRIREEGIREKVSGTALTDSFTSACAETCPTGAIVFGDLNDPRSKVHAARQNDRDFAVLEELGTVPRTRYLARVRNVNPELA